MNNQEFLRKLEKYAQKNLENDKTGHDYKHTKRVLKNALMIARYYPETDREILIVACLLHDIAFKYGFVKKHHIIHTGRNVRKDERVFERIGLDSDRPGGLPFFLRSFHKTLFHRLPDFFH